MNIDAKLINQILDVSQLSQVDRATTRLLQVLRGECRHVRSGFSLIQREALTGIYIQTEPFRAMDLTRQRWIDVLMSNVFGEAIGRFL